MDEILERTSELDARYVMQTYKRLPVAFVRGEGCTLWDSSGKQYLDLVSGLGVTILGHSHPAVVEAIQRQAAALLHTTNLYYVEPQPEVARLLVENSFPGRCFFANSGAEANEGALKLARKYHYQAGDPRDRTVCVLGSFHGRTMATLSATGQPTKWAPFAPTVGGFTHVQVNDVAALRDAIDRRTGAVLLEPVLGEGGVYPLSTEFLQAAREACDEHGALLILDEVQSGMGRTGKLFAYEHHAVLPDVMTVAKGLANGVPIGAIVASGKYAEVLAPGDHGTTFGGGFLACAAARATLEVLLAEDLPGRAASVGAVLMQRMQQIAAAVPLVTEVRGLGLMLAFELAEPLAREAVLRCLDAGVLVNDVSPSTVRMLPPLVIEEAEAQRGLDVLEQVLTGLAS